MNHPLISVIVPVFKVERYLVECIASLQNQKYDNLEILLVDDGSPDNCPSICDQFALLDSRIKVLHKQNGGLADARNVGLDYATGDYIAFVDGDDWVASETYSEMMAMLQANPDLDIVCCAASRMRQGEEVETLFSYYDTSVIKPSEEITRRILLDEIGSHVVKGLYKRKCWEKVRFPLGMLYEDIPTTYRAFMKAEKIGFIDEPFYKYRMNDEGISNTPKAIKPYYIYLGFKSHYECAAEHFPEIADRCCANTAQYAISTYFHYCSEGSKELEPAVPDVLQFMNEHKNAILRDTHMPRSRLLALRLYYSSETMFKLLCRTFHALGLQKRLGFGMK
ncbi:MAG: glycosyltransferase [Clostridia bacterium]|nr:glycosyltransferase [Clostridia bacterium]